MRPSIQPLILVFILAFGGQAVVAQQSQTADVKDVVEMHRVKVLFNPNPASPLNGRWVTE